MKQDIGLLFLRVSVGAMMLLAHGLDKLLGFNDMKALFPIRSASARRRA